MNISCNILHAYYANNFKYFNVLEHVTYYHMLIQAEFFQKLFQTLLTPSKSFSRLTFGNLQNHHYYAYDGDGILYTATLNHPMYFSFLNSLPVAVLISAILFLTLSTTTLPELKLRDAFCMGAQAHPHNFQTADVL